MVGGRGRVAVLATLVLMTGGCTAAEQRSSEDVGPSAPLPPRIGALAAGCPGPDVAPQFPPGGVLPEGATQVRICNVQGDPFGTGKDRVELDFLVPDDALTTDVDQVVDLVNATADEDFAPAEGTLCSGAASAGQVLWFSYPGTDLAVTYHDGADCADLDLGERQVAGGDAVAAAYSRLLWQQRSGRTPPAVQRRARCSPTVTLDTPLVLTEPLDLVDAVVCEYTADVRQARLTPEALVAVEGDFATTEGLGPRSGCPNRMLRGITAWGDRFSWLGTCWDFAVSNTFPTRLHWQPSPEVQGLLDALPLGPPRPQVTTLPGQPPGRVA